LRIEADDRESRSGVIDALRATTGVEVAVTRLALGDYAVNGNLLFERKTLYDFGISVIDGRLFQQAARLAEAPQRAVFVIEGTAADLASTGIQRPSLQGALIFVSLILGIPVLRSLEPTETAHLIVYAARQIQASARGGVRRAGYRPKGRERRRQYILQGLPGIGPQRARKLLERFGSIEAVVSADIAELATVEGIGKKTATNIKWLVSEQMACYGSETFIKHPHIRGSKYGNEDPTPGKSKRQCREQFLKGEQPCI
jgi:ERCC4-type nuclease